MITNNWYKYAKSIISSGYKIDGLQVTDQKGSAYDILSASAAKNCMFSRIGYPVQGTDKYGVVFGNGTTEPSPEDYRLSGTTLTSPSILASGRGSVSSNGTQTTWKGRFTLTNASSTQYAISEIAYITDSYYVSATNANIYAITDHSLVEPPLVLGPGEVGQIEYTITITYNDNSEVPAMNAPTVEAVAMASKASELPTVETDEESES